MSQPPSVCLGLDPSKTIEVFYLNRGVWNFGQSVENKMDAAEKAVKSKDKSGIMKKNARRRALESMIGAMPKRYRDPAAAAPKKKAAVKYSEAPPSADSNNPSSPDIVELGDDFGG